MLPYSTFIFVFLLVIILWIQSSISMQNSDQHQEQEEQTVPMVMQNKTCYSCFDTCKTADPSECDCSPESQQKTCQGPYCYARLEIFHQDGLTSIQKGCYTHLPGHGEGCHYSSKKDTIDCYCRGNECNNKYRLHNYSPKPRNQVKCCHCPHPEIGCEHEKCEYECLGDYCYYDLSSDAQSCGYGHPPLLTFFRQDPNKSPWNGSTICSRTVAGDVETLSHGCICGTNECNKPHTMGIIDLHYRESEKNNPSSNQSYCYSLVAASMSKPLEEAVYRKSETCEGNYCFVKWTSQNIALETTDYLDTGGDSESDESWSPDENTQIIAEKRYEIIAGCITANDFSQFNTGCSVEWSEDGKQATEKHCICEGHMCNYFHHISGDTLKKYLSHSQRFRGRVNDEERRERYGSSWMSSIASSAATSSRIRIITTQNLFFSSVSSFIFLCLILSVYASFTFITQDSLSS